MSVNALVIASSRFAWTSVRPLSGATAVAMPLATSVTSSTSSAEPSSMRRVSQIADSGNDRLSDRSHRRERRRRIGEQRAIARARIDAFFAGAEAASGIALDDQEARVVVHGVETGEAQVEHLGDVAAGGKEGILEAADPGIEALEAALDDAVRVQGDRRAGREGVGGVRVVDAVGDTERRPDDRLQQPGVAFLDDDGWRMPGDGVPESTRGRIELHDKRDRKHLRKRGEPA